MFEIYGAHSTPMAFSQAFVALQTEVIDGQENPFAQLWSAKLHEVHLSLTGHVYAPAYATVGRGPWSRLPEQVRTILEQTAKDAQPFVPETAARLDEALPGRLREAGRQENEATRTPSSTQAGWSTTRSRSRCQEQRR